MKGGGIYHRTFAWLQLWGKTQHFSFYVQKIQANAK